LQLARLHMGLFSELCF